MDKKFITHVAAETVVIGAMSFYFQKRISSLTDQIIALEKRLVDQESSISEHKKLLERQAAIIGQHEHFLVGMFGQKQAQHVGTFQKKNVKFDEPEPVTVEQVESTTVAEPPINGDAKKDEDDDAGIEEELKEIFASNKKKGLRRKQNTVELTETAE